MNTISEKIKMLTKVKEIAEAKPTTREILISAINDMIDELETELVFLSDCLTIDHFFNSVVSFIDYDNTTQISDDIEQVTGNKLQSGNWFEYYNNKKDELIQFEFITRIVLTDGSGWSYDVIYATNEGHALNTMISNYNAFEGDKVTIEHFNGTDWVNVGEYTWR